MTVVERRVIIHSYRSDGHHVVTHRKPGTTRPHDELEDSQKAAEKERKRLQAIAKRNNAYADKFKEW